MKYRNGFVSNSSSSSFIIPMDDISNAQMKKIKHFINENSSPQSIDYWRIERTEKDDINYWMFSTEMTNIDIEEYMANIGIELDKGYFDIAKKRINEAQNI